MTDLIGCSRARGCQVGIAHGLSWRIVAIKVGPARARFDENRIHTDVGRPIESFIIGGVRYCDRESAVGIDAIGIWIYFKFDPVLSRTFELTAGPII